MANISYIKLYNYLTEKADYERISALRTMYRLRKLPKELLNAVSQIMEGKTPDITINDVSYEELVDKDGMKPIAAILMLDWARREPEAALSYLAECTLRSPIMPLTKEQHDELDEAIAKLKQEVKEEVTPVNQYDESTEDIEVENASTIADSKTSLDEFLSEISNEGEPSENPSSDISQETDKKVEQEETK